MSDDDENHVRFSGLGDDADDRAAMLEFNASYRKLESPPPPPEVGDRIPPTPSRSHETTNEVVNTLPENEGSHAHENSGRVSFMASPGLAEIHFFEEPTYVHFAESTADTMTVAHPESPHRKLDSPPPTPEALESLSPLPASSSQGDLSLIMLSTDGGVTKSGHVCFAPNLEMVEPMYEELVVHFSGPKPDDTLNHEGPHRNIESPPPPPEILDMLKGSNILLEEVAQVVDPIVDENGPHVRFSASPQVVEFIPVTHAQVHFSDPAVDDATTDSDEPHRKLESPPPPLEADRLSPTPADLKKKEVLLLPIQDSDDMQDDNGPHVHFSSAAPIVESIPCDLAHVHFSDPVCDVTLEHIIPPRKLESPPPPPEIEPVLSAEQTIDADNDDEKPEGHVHFSSERKIVEITQPENAHVHFSSLSPDGNLDHVCPNRKLESPPPLLDERSLSPPSQRTRKPRDSDVSAVVPVVEEESRQSSREPSLGPTKAVKWQEPSEAHIDRTESEKGESLDVVTAESSLYVVSSLQSTVVSDISGDDNNEAALTISTSSPDGTPLTNSTRSSSSSNNFGLKRFASKELRGNLTRRQVDRDPLNYYEIIDVLGEGSMGSVARVRKRFHSSGGRSRQGVIVPTSEDATHGCFKLPFVGKLFQSCFWRQRKDAVSEISCRRTISGSFDELDSPSTGQIVYAMKSIHLNRCTDQTLVDELKNEVEMLKSLDHPHIVRAMETFEYRNQLFVTMEICSGGDLYTHDPYTEEEAARITMAILSAVSYMHSKGISHRDLKYENILFVNESPLAEIKLIDFGLSQRFGKGGLTDGVGTIYTMAPEVLKGKYSNNADLWSIGVIAYMLLSSQMPFYGRNRKEIIEQILRGSYDFKGRRWKRISKQGKAFIEDLLVTDPSDRATSDEAMKASWLNRRFGATVRIPHFEEIEAVKSCIVKYADYSKLKKVALMVIAHKSTAAEIGILRKFFQQYDTTGIGHLNYDQFKLAISAVGYNEQDYRKVFEAVDIDGSEKIRYTEFLAASIESRGALSEEKLAGAFERLDSDGTGFITADNLAEMLGNEINRDEIDAIMAESIVSNNGKISFEAFVGLWEEPNEPNEPNHYEIFRDVMMGGKIDSERSAYVSGMSDDESVSDARSPLHSNIGGPAVGGKQSVFTGSNRRVMFSE